MIISKLGLDDEIPRTVLGCFLSTSRMVAVHYKTILGVSHRLSAQILF